MVNLTTHAKRLRKLHTDLGRLMFLYGKLPRRLTSFLSHAGLFVRLLACLQNWVGLLLDFLEDEIARYICVFSYFKAIFIETSFVMIKGFVPSLPNGFPMVILVKGQVPDLDWPLAFESTQVYVLNSWKPLCWGEVVPPQRLLPEPILRGWHMLHTVHLNKSCQDKQWWNTNGTSHSWSISVWQSLSQRRAKLFLFFSKLFLIKNF